MSIRYTLRHNVPSTLVQSENDKYVNGSSDFDYNLMRKHELAETDDNRMVYRLKSGEIVDWTQAATTQATQIKDDCLLIKDDITEYANLTEGRIEAMVESSQEQQAEVQRLIVEIENMVDLETITDSEIDVIIEGDE